MTTQVQHVPIYSYKPNPCPASDPSCVTLISKPAVPRLYLRSIQVCPQTNPPRTSSVTPGASAELPGYAQIYINDYHTFCDLLRASPSQWAVDITYDDQTNVVSDFRYAATAPAMVAQLQQIITLLDTGVIEQ